MEISDLDSLHKASGCGSLHLHPPASRGNLSDDDLISHWSPHPYIIVSVVREGIRQATGK